MACATNRLMEDGPLARGARGRVRAGRGRLGRACRWLVGVDGPGLAPLSAARVTRWRADNVGFIFQLYNLVPVLTAFENVELPLLLTNLARRRGRENVLTALLVVGLSGRED